MSVRSAITLAAFCLASADLCAQERPVRDVTPSGVNRIYQPLSPVAAAAVATEKFSSARMQGDGSILADGRLLKLKGIAFPARNHICGQPPGARWACGMRAHGAARLALEHKTLECEKPAGGGVMNSPAAVTCWIERKDFALLLLERGWVYLAPSASELKPYATAAAIAQDQKVGLWADGPPEQAPKPKRPTSIP